MGVPYIPPPMLSLSSQRRGKGLESQAGIPYLLRTGAEPEDQAPAPLESANA